MAIPRGRGLVEGALVIAFILCLLPPTIVGNTIRVKTSEWEEMYQAAVMSQIVHFPALWADRFNQMKKYDIEFLEVWEEKSDKAMVAKVKGVDACFAAFRGADDVDPTVEYWGQNVDQNVRNVGGCQVRQGYYDAFDTKYRADFEAGMHKCMKQCTKIRCQEINGQEVCDQPVPCKIIFTGHSQGGTIAAIASLVHQEKIPTVVTFGAAQGILAPCTHIDPNRHFRFFNVLNQSTGNLYDIAASADGNGADHFGRTIMLGSGTPPVYLGLNDNKRRVAHSPTAHLPAVYVKRMKRILDYTENRRRHSLYIGGLKNGKRCGYDDECATGRCHGLIPPYKCKSKAKILDTCLQDKDCESDKCVLRANKMVCAQKDGKIPDGAPCDINRNCASGRCEGSIPPYNCRAKRKAKVLEKCSEPSDCESNKCLLRSTKMICALHNGKIPNGGPCDFDKHCQSGRCKGYLRPHKKCRKVR